jgi:uncharacterized protein DUF4157
MKQRIRKQRKMTDVREARVDSPEKDSDTSSLINTALSSEAQPLDNQTRAFMEPRFGHDFSEVRIHVGERSAEAAESVDALAFTTGNDVVFGARQYAPGTENGQQLIAHELAHVVQQGDAPAATISSPQTLSVSDPSDLDERWADQMATQVMTAAPGDVLESEGLLVSQSDGVAASIHRQAVGDAAPPQNANTQVQDPQAAVQDEAKPDDVWDQIKTRAIPELLIKLQEIGRAAGSQTKTQINELFQPYEDSLESDQTFLEIAGIGLGGAGNVPQGAAMGGVAGAVAEGTKVAMNHIMDLKSVGKAKERASTSIDEIVMGRLTSDSGTYREFEATALNELRADFDIFWANLSSAERRPTSLAVILLKEGLPDKVRSKYGVQSSNAQTALGSVRAAVAGQLVPVKSELERLKDSQVWHRAGAGALGGAAIGGLIGTAIAPGVGTLIGAGVGAVVGGVAGLLW